MDSLESTNLGSKHNRLQGITICPREGLSPWYPTPLVLERWGRGRDEREDADSHPEALDTLRHAHTHARRHTHANSHAHSLGQTPAPLLPTPFLSLFGGRGQTALFHLQASTPVFTCPDKTLIFCCSNFSWPACLPLPRVKSSHEIQVKATEQSMKILQPIGALRFLELK